MRQAADAGSRPGPPCDVVVVGAGLTGLVCAWALNLLLALIDAPFLRIISYILVISSTVQLVEMLMKKLSPATFRAMGIYLPLITTNCAILGLALFQTNREYDFPQCIAFSLGAGAGFTLALVLMAGLREKLELADLPDAVTSAANRPPDGKRRSTSALPTETIVG